MSVTKGESKGKQRLLISRHEEGDGFVFLKLKY